MSISSECTVSVVVPAYNEAANLPGLYAGVTRVLRKSGDSYEIVVVDDGSRDSTSKLVLSWRAQDKRVVLVRLSRNFGKESALAAGIGVARGRAVVMIDADGQHPPEFIPKFLKAWRKGAQVVIGVRNDKRTDIGWFKRSSSKLFYALFNRTTGQQIVPGSTDFRLIDRGVQQAFLELGETDRITRGLIDWLGFKRELIPFEVKPRQDGGKPNYDRRKLFKLATNSFVSMSPRPLYIFGYLGILITIGAFLLGLAVFVEQLILEDPLHWKFTGTAMLGILILFLVGVVLMSQGILSLYISHIHSQSMHRPLYVIDYAASAGVKTKRG